MSELFEEVFIRLIARVDTTARTECRTGWRRSRNAPARRVRRLAEDDDITIARPVLKHVAGTDESDLVGIAETRTSHIYWPSGKRRRSLEPVTEKLVARGDREGAAQRGRKSRRSVF